MATPALVLVVHDHPVQREVLRSLLADAGCRTLTATGGVEGFDCALASRPDVIVSDVQMRGMNGFDLCRAVKILPMLCHTPVLLIGSLLTSSHSAEEGFDAGAADYLPMAYVPSQLVRKVRYLASGRRG